MKKFKLSHSNGVVFEIPEDILFQNWRDLNICFFDLEATGVNPKQADILQFCGIVLTDLTTDDYTIVKEEEFLVRPKQENIGSSEEIHNIGYDDVGNKPAFNERGETLYQFFNIYSDVLLAWNGLGYDMPLLVQQYDRYLDDTYRPTWPCLDPLVIERRRRQKLSGNSLSRAAKRYGAQTLQNLMQQEQSVEASLHDARQDVTLMIDVVMERLETYYYCLHEFLDIQKESFERQQAHLNDKYDD